MARLYWPLPPHWPLPPDYAFAVLDCVLGRARLQPGRTGSNRLRLQPLRFALLKQMLLVHLAEPIRYSPVLSPRSPKTRGAPKSLPLLSNL